MKMKIKENDQSIFRLANENTQLKQMLLKNFGERPKEEYNNWKFFFFNFE